MINCVNCGAQIDKMYNGACPHCGTYNIDMSMIDLDSHTPVGIILKIGGNVMSCVCVPEGCSVTNSIDAVNVYKGIGGNKLYTTYGDRKLYVSMNFTAIPDLYGNLMKRSVA